MTTRGSLRWLSVGMTCSLVWVLGCAPIGPLAGGRLRGPAQAPPVSWELLRPYDTVQLETRPGNEYSVNVWGTAIDGEFWVACRPSSRWLPYVRADSRVRLRIHGSIYELEATIDRDRARIDAFFDQLDREYDWRPTPEDRARALLIRMRPRSGA